MLMELWKRDACDAHKLNAPVVNFMKIENIHFSLYVNFIKISLVLIIKQKNLRPSDLFTSFFSDIQMNVMRVSDFQMGSKLYRNS